MEWRKEKHMPRENLAIGLVTMLLRVERLASNSPKRRQGTVAKLLGILLISITALAAQALDPSREPVIKIVGEIQRADYEGDRTSLKRLYEELTPVAQSTKLASRVRYWRGFALWRRAMNGFNESADPKELEEDLRQAVTEFGEALRIDPGFVDAKVGAISCLSNLIFLNQKNAARVQDLAAQAVPLRKEAEAAEPENPRLLWVLGPICWYAPPERGCGQDKAMEMDKKGLEAARKQKGVTSDPLEPSWGEPELLAALAWANLNRTEPDLKAAEQYARSAVDIVPYWHYVRDILIPQIQEAKKKPH
jgi:tetratricopeptide (TPR) repeat protein